MIAALLRWLSGDLAGALTRAYELRLKAENDQQRQTRLGDSEISCAL